MLEIIAFEQQRLTRCLGERIREAVAEIERCGMIAAAEVDVGFAGDADLRLRYRLDADAGPLDERIQPAPGARTGLVVDNDSRFQEIGGRDQTHRIAQDGARESSGFRLLAQDGDERRAVDHHQRGNPRSP
jgi:hypothetical protein